MFCHRLVLVGFVLCEEMLNNIKSEDEENIGIVQEYKGAIFYN